MLIGCSKKKDVKEWNEWRKEHLGDEILLEGADLLGAHLHGVELSDYGGIARSPTVCLKGATLLKANLGCARMIGSDLQDADLSEAHLVGAKMPGACLKGASLRGARLNGTYLMHGLYSPGTCFDGAHLESTDFQRAVVDSSTSFWGCMLNRDTDFREVALEGAQLEQSKKQLLKYNMRRMNWEDWYPEHNWLLAWLVRKFWRISDYGISSKQVIWTFF